MVCAFTQSPFFSTRRRSPCPFSFCHQVVDQNTLKTTNDYHAIPGLSYFSSFSRHSRILFYDLIFLLIFSCRDHLYLDCFEYSNVFKQCLSSDECSSSNNLNTRTSRIFLYSNIRIFLDIYSSTDYHMSMRAYDSKSEDRAGKHITPCKFQRRYLVGISFLFIRFRYLILKKSAEVNFSQMKASYCFFQKKQVNHRQNFRNSFIFIIFLATHCFPI